MAYNFFDLTGKVAIVSGTSRGLGQFMGRALAKAGADLVITSRDKNWLEEYKAEIKSLGRKAFPCELNVRYDSIQQCVEETYSHYGKIDILVKATRGSTSASRPSM